MLVSTFANHFPIMKKTDTQRYRRRAPFACLFSSKVRTTRHPLYQLQTAIETASGAPGHEYYQQKADYDMDITLDDKNQTISGKIKNYLHQ